MAFNFWGVEIVGKSGTRSMVFVYGDGGLDFFRSLQDAEGYMEVVEVLSRVYEHVIDSELNAYKINTEGYHRC